MKTIKRLITLLIVVCMLAAMLPIVTFAASTSALTFKLTGDKAGYYVSDCKETASGSLTIPASYNGKPVTSIGYAAFASCDSLTSIKIPDSVTSIGDWAFNSCDGLRSITIPDRVTSIGEWAFSYCSSLTSVTIGNSVTSIGYAAFTGCNSLTCITVPDSVTTIGEGAFPSSSSLTGIWVDSNNPSYSSDSYGVLFNKSKTALVQAPGALRGSYTIPDSVVSIERSAFWSCGLTSISIPDSVISIGNYAFHGCDSLTKITIPDSVTAIGEDAFSYCNSLTNVSIRNGVNSIGKYAFSYCNSLISITLPDSITSIGEGSFKSCKSLTRITIPGSVTTMGEAAFAFCNSLTNVTIESGVTSVGKSAFSYCNSLTSITIPDSVTSIGNSAFYRCNNLSHIYYIGTEEKWNMISCGDNNSYLLNAKIHYLPVNEPEMPNINDIQFGPYALKGAEIEVLGYKIPLINIDADIELSIGDHLKVIADDGKTMQILIGFDENAKANVDGSKNSPKYWSESYREVKSMYQDLTGKKVDTTRLWNKFSSMRGKLKPLKASMVVDVDAQLAGYLEFTNTNGVYKLTEGGMLASFSADASLRSYYGPFYVALGVGVGVDGKLYFIEEENTIRPHISVEPEFTVSAGVGIGTRKTYAEVDAYGSLEAVITTQGDVPFSAGVDLGVKWKGYLFGKQIFSDSKSFASMELYPNFGEKWKTYSRSLINVDVSDVDSYTNLINSATPISRDYLATTYMLRSSNNYEGTNFIKRNAYPLSSPNLVRFDDDTMLLIWVDDNGEKIVENMSSIMYSYFDGAKWSTPSYIYEDGTTNDMPSVHSDGENAYIVWQKSTKVFESGVETSEMLQYFDLYMTVFDSTTDTFSTPISITPEDEYIFEFNPIIYGRDGNAQIAWIENTDNNIYQMSGDNYLKAVSVDSDGNIVESKQIVTQNMFTDVSFGNGALYYSVIENKMNNLYCYETESILIKEEINNFDCAGDVLFYSDATGLYSYDGKSTVKYANLDVVDNFSVETNGTEYVLFTTVLREDFTKVLYFSRLLDLDSSWSNFELYSDTGTYIRDYSPVILSDSAVHIAFNYVAEDAETGSQSASIVVDQCTDEVDIAVEYVTFDERQLTSRNVDLMIGVQNKSSSVMESFTVCVTDHTGNTVYENTVNATLEAFGDCELIINYDLPDEDCSEVYSISVVPTDYVDREEENNLINTTFECVHIMPEEWTIVIAPTLGVNGVKVRKCTKCGITLEEAEVALTEICGHNVTENGICIECGITIGAVVVDFADNVMGNYVTFAEAMDAAMPAQTVRILTDVSTSDFILVSDVLLDLNGHTLIVDSVLTYSSSAIIDTSEDASGLLKINDTDGNMISKDNSSLPVYDSVAGGYRFFAIDVEPCAVTGGNKYWFKIKAEKFAPLYNLINADADVQIKVKMTWDGQTEDVYAAADLAFTKTWADRYNANEDVYITVTVTETEGLENFKLIPIITSGGVEISGEEM